MKKWDKDDGYGRDKDRGSIIDDNKRLEEVVEEDDVVNGEMTKTGMKISTKLKIILLTIICIVVTALKIRNYRLYHIGYKDDKLYKDPYLNAGILNFFM